MSMLLVFGNSPSADDFEKDERHEARVAFSRKDVDSVVISHCSRWVCVLGVTIAGSQPAHGLSRIGDVATSATFGNRLTVQRPTTTTAEIYSSPRSPRACQVPIRSFHRTAGP